MKNESMPFAQSGTSFHLFVYLFNNLHYFIYLLRGFFFMGSGFTGFESGIFCSEDENRSANQKPISIDLPQLLIIYCLSKLLLQEIVCLRVKIFLFEKFLFLLDMLTLIQLCGRSKEKKNYFPFFCDLNPNLQHTIMTNLTGKT